MRERSACRRVLPRHSGRDGVYFHIFRYCPAGKKTDEDGIGICFYPDPSALQEGGMRRGAERRGAWQKKKEKEKKREKKRRTEREKKGKERTLFFLNLD